MVSVLKTDGVSKRPWVQIPPLVPIKQNRDNNDNIVNLYNIG